MDWLKEEKKDGLIKRRKERWIDWNWKKKRKMDWLKDRRKR